MKRVLLLIASFIMCAFAVNADPEWGLTAGLNVSTWNGSDCDARAGFNIGVKMEDEVSAPFFIEAGALLSNKGCKWSQDMDNSWDENFSLWYLHVPVNFGYKFDLNENLQIAPKVGIYGAVGLWGDDGNDNDPFYDFDNKSNNSVSCDNFNHFDFGFNLGVNFYVQKHFEVSTGYEFGMVNVWDGIKYDDNKVLKADDSKNRNWYLNLAFLF
jgi:hypothetical protein